MQLFLLILTIFWCPSLLLEEQGSVCFALGACLYFALLSGTSPSVFTGWRHKLWTVSVNSFCKYYLFLVISYLQLPFLLLCPSVIPQTLWLLQCRLFFRNIITSKAKQCPCRQSKKIIIFMKVNIVPKYYKVWSNGFFLQNCGLYFHLPYAWQINKRCLSGDKSLISIIKTVRLNNPNYQAEWAFADKSLS